MDPTTAMLIVKALAAGVEHVAKLRDLAQRAKAGEVITQAEINAATGARHEALDNWETT